MTLDLLPDNFSPPAFSAKDSSLGNFLPENSSPENFSPDNFSSRMASGALTKTGGFLAGFTHTLQPYIGCRFGCEYCYR